MFLRHFHINFAARDPFLRHFHINFAVPKGGLNMCRLCCFLGPYQPLSSFVRGLLMPAPSSTSTSLALKGLDHTQVTYRTSRCLVHFHRDEPLPAISSALIRTLVVLCIASVLLDQLRVLRVVFWFISKQIVPYGRACHLCVPEGLCMVRVIELLVR